MAEEAQKQINVKEIDKVGMRFRPVCEYINDICHIPAVSYWSFVMTFLVTLAVAQTEISQTNIVSMEMNFLSDVHDSEIMNPIDFGDPLTFHVAPSSQQDFNFSNTRTNAKYRKKTTTIEFANVSMFFR